MTAKRICLWLTLIGALLPAVLLSPRTPEVDARSGWANAVSQSTVSTEEGQTYPLALGAENTRVGDIIIRHDSTHLYVEFKTEAGYSLGAAHVCASVAAFGWTSPERAGGFILLFAQKRSKFRRPFFRVPRSEGEGWIWLFDITTTSNVPGADPDFVNEMLARNRQLFERAREIGGTRYPIGAQIFSREDWLRQYDDSWPEFARRKKKYDPDNILTPGPGIF